MRRYFVPVLGTLFVALPMTLMYGLIALIGSLSMIDVVEVWMGTHIWKNEIDWYEYTQAFSGLFGVLGIIGLWLGSLFYEVIKKANVF